MAALGPGCVKTQKILVLQKIGLSKRAPRRFLGVGNGNPTHEYFKIWSFHTAWGDSGRNRRSGESCKLCQTLLLVHNNEIRPHPNQRHARFQPDPILIALGRCRTFPRQVASPAARTASIRLMKNCLIDIGDRAVQVLHQRFGVRVLKQNLAERH
jgi:hypothetical protein